MIEVKNLSTGQKQRTSIARCLVHNPSIYIFDEPTLGLDVISSKSIIDFMKNERDKGKTVLYSTHYMEEVELICDRIIILDKGRIIASGTSDELKKLANIEEKITVEVTNMSSSILENIKKFKTVDSVTYDRNVLSIIYRKGKNNLEELMDYLKENKVSYNKIFSERPTLNDVFLELTGKGLRDAI